MSSTYSSNLRLELMGTGDQVGTWGTTANNNFGGLLETAVTGYTSVSVTAAAQALTAANGAADQARNASIALTTTTAANFAVYIPPSPKLYVFYNASAYSATIYNSTVLGNTTAAGTGVTIPAGKTVPVWSDGTNVAVQINHLPATTTAATQAAGDNSTKLATTAYADGAVAAVGMTGEIKMWPTAAAPAGYLLCRGQAVSRATYAALFAVLGTTFGAGDGATTFNVPNYVDRMPIGAGNLYALAAAGGSKDAIVPAHTHAATFTGAALPAHGHTTNDPGHFHPVGGTSGGGGSGAVSIAGSGVDTGTAFTGVTVSNASAGTPSGTVAVTSTGTSVTDANLPPYMGINFIIKT